MQIVVHRNIPQGEELRRRWNELVMGSESPQVFYTYEWACAVASAYASSLIPLLILGYESGRLIGVASLAVGSDSNRASFLAGQTADYCDFVSLPEFRAEFVRRVFTEVKALHIECLTLANLPAESGTAGLLKPAAGGHGYHSFQRPAYVCAQVLLGPDDEREILRNSICRRKAFRYALKALGRRGAVSFQHCQNNQDFEELFPAFVKAHVARFEANGKISNLASPERRNFLMRLADLLSAAGWLKFSYMLVGDRPVAWNYGFHFAGNWFYYQPAFEADVREFSPGMCLLSRIIEEAAASTETDVVDLGLGAEGYKERFANAERSTIHVEVLDSIVRRSGTALRYYAAASVKSVPALETGVRAGLRAISNLSRYARAMHL